MSLNLLREFRLIVFGLILFGSLVLWFAEACVPLDGKPIRRIAKSIEPVTVVQAEVWWTDCVHNVTQRWVQATEPEESEIVLFRRRLLAEPRYSELRSYLGSVCREKAEFNERMLMALAGQGEMGEPDLLAALLPLQPGIYTGTIDCTVQIAVGKEEKSNDERKPWTVIIGDRGLPLHESGRELDPGRTIKLASEDIYATVVSVEGTPGGAVVTVDFTMTFPSVPYFKMTGTEIATYKRIDATRLRLLASSKATGLSDRATASYQGYCEGDLRQ